MTGPPIEDHWGVHQRWNLFSVNNWFGMKSPNEDLICVPETGIYLL